MRSSFHLHQRVSPWQQLRTALTWWALELCDLGPRERLAELFGKQHGSLWRALDRAEQEQFDLPLP